KKLERPARTIRFIFPPEIEGTLALLNAKPSHVAFKCEADPQKVEQTCASSDPAFDAGASLAKRIKAVVPMSTVGGGPDIKAGMGDGSLHANIHPMRMGALGAADEIHHKRKQISGACEGGEVERFEIEQVRPMVESVKRLAPDTKEMRGLTIGKVAATLDNNS